MRFIYIGGLLLLASVQSAVADTSWYLGVGGGVTGLRTAGFGSNSGLSTGLPMGDSVEAGEFSDTPSGWQIYGAFMLTENFGLLLKYSDSGDGKDLWNVNADIAANPPPTSYTFAGEMKMDGFTVYALQTIPFANNFDFTIELFMIEV